MDRSVIFKSEKYIMVAIFSATVLHLVSMLCEKFIPAIELPFDFNTHIMRPLCYNLVELIGGLIMFWYARRLNACAYTKIVSLIYIIMLIICLSYILCGTVSYSIAQMTSEWQFNPIEYSILINISIAVSIACISFVFLLYLFQPCLRKLYRKISKP